jgi:predicted amino acid-binding ACT domain protein
MVTVVDMTGTAGYEAFAEGLRAVGEDIGVDISVRLYSVYEAMHRI